MKEELEIHKEVIEAIISERVKLDGLKLEDITSIRNEIYHGQKSLFEFLVDNKYIIQVNSNKNRKSIDNEYLDKIFNIKTKNLMKSVGFSNIQGTMKFSTRRKSINHKTAVASIVLSIKYILPKRYREEYSVEIVQIFQELRSERHSKVYCYFITGLHVLSVVWCAFCFKYDDFFGKERKSSNK